MDCEPLLEKAALEQHADAILRLTSVPSSELRYDDYAPLLAPPPLPQEIQVALPQEDAVDDTVAGGATEPTYIITDTDASEVSSLRSGPSTVLAMELPPATTAVEDMIRRVVEQELAANQQTLSESLLALMQRQSSQDSLNHNDINPIRLQPWGGAIVEESPAASAASRPLPGSSSDNDVGILVDVLSSSSPPRRRSCLDPPDSCSGNDSGQVAPHHGRKVSEDPPAASISHTPSGDERPCRDPPHGRRYADSRVSSRGSMDPPDKEGSDSEDDSPNVADPKNESETDQPLPPEFEDVDLPVCIPPGCPRRETHGVRRVGWRSNDSNRLASEHSSSEASSNLVVQNVACEHEPERPAPESIPFSRADATGEDQKPAAIATAARDDMAQIGGIQRMTARPAYPRWNSVLITPRDRASSAKQKGLCVKCQRKTHKGLGVNKTPLTNDHVYRGHCLCDPSSIPHEVLREWMHRNNSFAFKSGYSTGSVTPVGSNLGDHVAAVSGSDRSLARTKEMLAQLGDVVDDNTKQNIVKEVVEKLLRQEYNGVAGRFGHSSRQPTLQAEPSVPMALPPSAILSKEARINEYTRRISQGVTQTGSMTYATTDIVKEPGRIQLLDVGSSRSAGAPDPPETRQSDRSTHEGDIAPLEESKATFPDSLSRISLDDEDEAPSKDVPTTQITPKATEMNQKKHADSIKDDDDEDDEPDVVLKTSSFIRRSVPLDDDSSSSSEEESLDKIESSINNTISNISYAARPGMPPKCASDFHLHVSHPLALTQEEEEIAKRKGRCPCGIKTHKISVLRKKPLTNEDVHSGYCIRCNPKEVPVRVLLDWMDRQRKTPTVHFPAHPYPTMGRVSSRPLKQSASCRSLGLEKSGRNMAFHGKAQKAPDLPRIGEH